MKAIARSMPKPYNVRVANHRTEGNKAMKRYVTELANDIIKSNRANTLMSDEARGKIEGIIAAILDDYKAGLISAHEAVHCMTSEHEI